VLAYRISGQWKEDWIFRKRPSFIRNCKIWLFLSLKEIIIYFSLFLTFFKKSNKANTKFIIFGSGRTGSTLLVNLLNSSSEIQCDGEILHFNVYFPNLLIKALHRRSRKNFYGFKVKPEHFTKSQIIPNPSKFLFDLYKDGWKIIYLRRRNIFRHALSSMVAEARGGKWFIRAKNTQTKIKKVYINCDKLISNMENRFRNIARESEILNNTPHVSVVYDDDLLNTENHQKTLDKLFKHLNIPSVPVKTYLQRTTSDKISDFIENSEEILHALSKTKFAQFIDDQ